MRQAAQPGGGRRRTSSYPAPSLLASPPFCGAVGETERSKKCLASSFSASPLAFFLSPVDCLDGIPQFEASREALSLSSASKFISSMFHRLLTRTCMRCPPPCNNRQVRFAEMSRAESTEGKIEGFRGKTSWEPAGEGSGCGVAAATVAAGFVRKVDLRCSTRRRKKRR